MIIYQIKFSLLRNYILMPWYPIGNIYIALYFAREFARSVILSLSYVQK